MVSGQTFQTLWVRRAPITDVVSLQRGTVHSLERGESGSLRAAAVMGEGENVMIALLVSDSDTVVVRVWRMLTVTSSHLARLRFVAGWHRGLLSCKRAREQERIVRRIAEAEAPFTSAVALRPAGAREPKPARCASVWGKLWKIWERLACLERVSCGVPPITVGLLSCLSSLVVIL